MLAALAVDRLADRHIDNAWRLDKSLARPAFGRRHRNRHHPGTGHDRQACRARLVLAAFTACNARAFGEHDHPDALAQQALALLHHLVERAAAVLAVDMDHVQAADGPAKERNLQQLLFEHIGQRRRHDGGHQKGLKGRLVLAQQHHTLVTAGLAGDGQILHALDTHPNAAEPASAVCRQLEPAARHCITGPAAGTAHPQQQDGQGVGDHRQAHEERVQNRSDQRHGASRKAGRTQKVETSAGNVGRPNCKPGTGAAASCSKRWTDALARASAGSGQRWALPARERL